MATPNYDALKAKVVSWSNRDVDVLGNTTVEQQQQVADFLSYAADDLYRILRIPPLEYDRIYTIEAADIIGSPNVSVLSTNNWAGGGGVSYNKIQLPVDFVEMTYLRYNSTTTPVSTSGQVVNPGIVFNERTDERTFFDVYAETYSNYYWMRSGDFLFIKPALPVGASISFHYYRQLPALNAEFLVNPLNFLFTANNAGVNQPSTIQPFLTAPVAPLVGLPLYFINAALRGTSYTVVSVPAVNQLNLASTTGLVNGFKMYDATRLLGSITNITGNVVTLDTNLPATVVATSLVYIAALSLPTAAYASAAERDVAYAAFVPVAGYVISTSTSNFTGLEVGNWLKDQNERLLIWAALKHYGAYLDDDKMEARYEKKYMEDVARLNMEERMRRAKGGNVQTNFNRNGLI